MGGALKPARLAIAEDGGEMIRGSSRYGDGLRKEHRAFAVVSSGEIDEMTRSEFWIAIRGAFQGGEPWRPGGANEERLKARISRSIRRVERKKREVFASIRALAFRVIRGEGLPEIGTRAAAIQPCTEIEGEAVEVIRLMREPGPQTIQRRKCIQREPLGLGTRFRRDTAIVILKRSQRIDRSLERCPISAGRPGFAMGFSLRRPWRSLVKGGLGEPIHEIQPKLEMIELPEPFVSEKDGIGDDRDASSPDGAEADQARIRGPRLLRGPPGDFGSIGCHAPTRAEKARALHAMGKR